MFEEEVLATSIPFGFKDMEVEEVTSCEIEVGLRLKRS